MPFTITYNLINCKGVDDNPTEINENEKLTLMFEADPRYFFNRVVANVDGADTVGELVMKDHARTLNIDIENATGNVTVYVNAQLNSTLILKYLLNDNQEFEGHVSFDDRKFSDKWNKKWFKKNNV